MPNGRVRLWRPVCLAETGFGSSGTFGSSFKPLSDQGKRCDSDNSGGR